MLTKVNHRCTMKTLTLTGLIFCLLLSSQIDAKVTTTATSALTYQNKPIDALCFFDFQGKQSKVALNKCGLQSDHDRKLQTVDQDLIKKGYVGFDYTYTIDANTQQHGASYYKVLGKFNQAYLLYTINNSGGSGEFTALISVKRNQDSLQIKTLVSGDRCNGGIVNPNLSGSMLSFQQNITPFDLLEVADNNTHHIKAYDDLAACAACCLGVVNYKFDLNHLQDNPAFSSVQLNETNPDEANTQGKYQACFNKTSSDYFTQTHKKSHDLLAMPELKKLTALFNQHCVK